MACMETRTEREPTKDSISGMNKEVGEEMSKGLEEGNDVSRRQRRRVSYDRQKVNDLWDTT